MLKQHKISATEALEYAVEQSEAHPMTDEEVLWMATKMCGAKDPDELVDMLVAEGYGE
jgi:hypothetical protein